MPGPVTEADMKVKRYYGWNVSEGRVMLACITGQMSDGTYVYTECDPACNLIDPEKQYTRRLRHGWQDFIRL